MSSSDMPTKLNSSTLTAQEAKLLTALYLAQRVNYQSDFYERRKDEFTFNSEVMLWMSAIIMGLSAILSAYSITSDNAFWAFLTALLPAFAAAIAAFRTLYQWDSQAALYDDSWYGLQEARLEVPDPDAIDSDEEYLEYFPRLVNKTEQVLQQEAAQWGQLVGSRTPDDELITGDDDG